jgi:hypothetical protein
MRAMLVNTATLIAETHIEVDPNALPTFEGYWIVLDPDALGRDGYLYTPTDPNNPEAGGTFSDSGTAPVAPPAVRIVDPICVPRAFIAALGDAAGKSAWAKIRLSTYPDCLYWMSEWAAAKSVNVDYSPLPGALAALLTIDGGDGQPILTAGQPDAILTALQGMTGL